MPDPEPWKPTKPPSKAAPRVGDQVKGGVLGPKAEVALQRAAATIGQVPPPKVVSTRVAIRIPKVSTGAAAGVGLLVANKDAIGDALGEYLANSVTNSLREAIAEERAFLDAQDTRRNTEEKKKNRSGSCPKTSNRASDGSKCGGRAASVRGKTAGYEGFRGIKDGVPIPGPVTKPTAPQKADRSTYFLKVKFPVKG